MSSKAEEEEILRVSDPMRTCLANVWPDEPEKR